MCLAWSIYTFPVLHNKMFVFLSNDKPVIKIRWYGIIFLVVIITEKCQILWRKILLLSNLSLFESENIFSQKIISESKKIYYCYGFMLGDFQVICASMVGKNHWSSASTETPALHTFKTFFNLPFSFEVWLCWATP